MSGEVESPAARLSPLRIKPSMLLLCCLLLVVSSVAWRKGTYYSGGADAVVVVKAALTCAAVVLAWLMPRSRESWARFRATPMVWLAGYLLISVIGASLNGEATPSLILAIRLAILSVGLLLLVVSHPWQDVLSSLSGAMLLLTGFSIATGLGSLTETGRLYGGLPPLNANEICLLVSVPVVLLFWKVVNGAARRVEYVAIFPLMGVVWLTGSRTGLAALIVVLALILLLAPRVPTLVVVGLALAIPTIIYLTFFTPLVTDFASRGEDAASVATLNSRTVAWQAAFDYPDNLAEKLVGSGLSLKQIPVTAMYRNEQILDSTWVSALLQVGYLGFGLLGLFVLSSVIRAAQLPRPKRSLVLGLLILVTMVSVLESGMFDTTPAFIVFFMMVLLAHQVQSPILRHEGRHSHQPSMPTSSWTTR